MTAVGPEGYPPRRFHQPDNSTTICLAIRRDRRLAKNQNGKRKVVVVIRERDGKTLPGVFRTERAAAAFIRRRVAIGRPMATNQTVHALRQGEHGDGAACHRMTQIGLDMQLVSFAVCHFPREIDGKSVVRRGPVNQGGV